MNQKQVSLTDVEIEFIKGFLLARRIYKPYGEKWGCIFWTPMMEDLLNKLDKL
jgi:hypothetical protein